MPTLYHQLWLAPLALLACALTPHCGIAQVGLEPAANQSQATLQVGAAAPKLVVDHWLSGEPVESFAPGRVYVVEFWATWCGPCIKSMPHLNELANRYADEGLVVIATTKTDESNTLDAIKNFASGPGKDYRFLYAACEGDAAYKAYMEDAGQQGIPCSFVIDRDGKLAYVGHPHDLDYVLERVMAGKWRGKEDADELRKMNDSIASLAELAMSDAPKALEMVEHIRRVNPRRVNSLDFAYVEVIVLCQNQRFDLAKDRVESAARPSMEAADWGTLAMLGGALASPELNPEGQHRDVALAKIKEAEVALNDDWQNLLQVGIAYMSTGDFEKYKTCMNRVIELCPDETLKKSLQLSIEMQEKYRDQ